MKQNQQITPQIKESMENDEAVLNFVLDSMKAIRVDRKNTKDFPTELSWVLETVTRKCLNKAESLYKIGIIFIGNCIAVNSGLLGKCMCLSQQILNKKINKWYKQYWDIDSKTEILSRFDPPTELRAWELRRPPEDDPILVYSSVVPPLINVNPANSIKENIDKQNGTVPQNICFIKTNELITLTNCSIPSNLWKFNSTPDEVIFFD